MGGFTIRQSARGFVLRWRDFFWPLPILGRKMSKKSPNCQGLAQCRSGPDNDMVSERNHHSIVPFFNNHSAPPRQFLRDKILLKRISWGNVHWTSCWIWIEFPGTPGHRRSQEIRGSHLKGNVISMTKMWQKSLLFLEFQFLSAFFAYNAFF